MSNPNRNGSQGTSEMGPSLLLQMLGITKENLRDGQKFAKMNSFNSCCHCGKEEEKIKKCAKCKVTYYCSKDCQKADWNHHKANCGNPNVQGHISDAKRLQQFAVLLHGSSHLTHYFKCSVAALFDLDSYLRAPEPSTPSTPMFAEVQVVVLPIHAEDRIMLLSSSNQDVGRPIPGAFQIAKIVRYEKPCSEDVSQWHAIREDCIAYSGKDSFTILNHWRFRDAVVASTNNFTYEDLLRVQKRKQTARQDTQSSPLGSVLAQAPPDSFYKSDNPADIHRHLLRALNSAIMLDSLCSQALKMRTTMMSPDIEVLRRLNSDPEWREEINLRDAFVELYRPQS